MEEKVKDNPKSLSIGDKVVVTHRTDMVYIDGNRVQEHIRLLTPIECWIVGGVRRQLGKYRKGCWHPSTYSFDADYESPSLEVTGTVFHYQCRHGFKSKIFDVSPEHVQPLINTVLGESK